MAARFSPSIAAPQSTGFPLSLNQLSEFSAGLTPTSIASTLLVLVVSLLIAEQSYWRWRKGSLPGLTWQIVRCSFRETDALRRS